MTNKKGLKSRGSYTARKEKIRTVKNCCDLLSRLVESKEIRRGVVRLSYQCFECGEIVSITQEVNPCGARPLLPQ